MIQSGDFSFHAAAPLQINERVCAGRKNVSGTYDVRCAKQNNTVAIRMRMRLVIDDDSLAIESKILFRARECLEGFEQAFPDNPVLKRMTINPENASRTSAKDILGDEVFRFLEARNRRSESMGRSDRPRIVE